MNDYELLNRFHNGDEKAFEAIYRRYHTNIFFICAKYFLSAEEAQDVRSSCFIKLWTLRDKLVFENLQSLYSWLKSTAVNQCIDYKRKAALHASKMTEIEKQILSENDTYVFELADKEALIVNRLLTRLEKLPIKFKEVFKMRCYDELKFVEIAKLLNENVSTVKKRYARAVKLIRLISVLFL